MVSSRANRIPLPETGFVRLFRVIGPVRPIPVSKSTWWDGVRNGRYPKPVKLGPRITAWRVEDIRKLIDTLGCVPTAKPIGIELSTSPSIQPRPQAGPRSPATVGVMDAETIAKALGGRQVGGGWTARCPCHDDREPSLSICDGDDGKVLVHCHGGCEQDRVVAVLHSLGLWERNSNRRRGRPPLRVASNDAPDRDDAKRTDAALAIWQSATSAGEPWSRPTSSHVACVVRYRRHSVSMPG